jgi:hypothetical protein
MVVYMINGKTIQVKDDIQTLSSYTLSDSMKHWKILKLRYLLKQLAMNHLCASTCVTLAAIRTFTHLL